MSLREISENVKLAREYALLGNYNSASVLYHGLLEQIKMHMYTVRDSSFQQRWQQVNTPVRSHTAHSDYRPYPRPLLLRLSLFDNVSCLCVFCLFLFVPVHFQLWQEISEENRQVQDIMSTLENFQLDSSAVKPSNQEDCEIRPLHVEQR